MVMSKKKKIILIIVLAAVASLALAVAIPFTVYGVRSASIKDDYASLKNDAHYSTKVEVSGIELVTQHISCGYASIEMLSSFYGAKVSEDELSQRNGGAISTASTDGFFKEIGRSIPAKSFEKKTYLKHSEYLKEIHDSLARQNPVAIEWAAKYEGVWTLHFSVVSALHIAEDQVTVYNPYGYIENIGVDEFIDRVSFEAYKDIPLFLSFGFAYGAFDKNGLFYAV